MAVRGRNGPGHSDFRTQGCRQDRNFTVILLQDNELSAGSMLEVESWNTYFRGNLMKNRWLFVLPILLLLSGCASYGYVAGSVPPPGGYYSSRYSNEYIYSDYGYPYYGGLGAYSLGLSYGFPMYYSSPYYYRYDGYRPYFSHRPGYGNHYRPGTRPPSHVGGGNRPRPPSSGGGGYRPRPPSTGGNIRPPSSGVRPPVTRPPPAMRPPTGGDIPSPTPTPRPQRPVFIPRS
jgi:hypothetical protein